MPKLYHGALLLSRQCSLRGAAELEVVVRISTTLVLFFSGDLRCGAIFFMMIVYVSILMINIVHFECAIRYWKTKFPI